MTEDELKKALLMLIEELIDEKSLRLTEIGTFVEMSGDVIHLAVEGKPDIYWKVHFEEAKEEDYAV